MPHELRKDETGRWESSTSFKGVRHEPTVEWSGRTHAAGQGGQAARRMRTQDEAQPTRNRTRLWGTHATSSPICHREGRTANSCDSRRPAEGNDKAPSCTARVDAATASYDPSRQRSGLAWSQTEIAGSQG